MPKGKRKESLTVVFARRKIMRTMGALAKEIRTQAKKEEDLFTRQDLLALADYLEERVQNGLGE